MSNQQVGNVFDRVIQDVCDSSQIDFEESGVDQTTLLDLRQSWQKKLSSLGVAHFPWDPTPQQPTAPQPQHQPQNQTQNQIRPPITTVPSNVPSTTRPPQAHQHVPAQSFSHSLPQSVPATTAPVQAPVPTSMPNDIGQPHIKQEPGVNGQSPAMSNIAPSHPSNNQSARERAASMLHQRYGAAAANSVSQLQAQPQGPMAMPPRPNNMQSPNGQGPTIKTEPGYPPITQPSVGNAQTDGAGDALSEWKVEVARRRAAAEGQNGEGDRILRGHLKQRMNQLEGGGLLIPLEERQAPSRNFTSQLGLASPTEASTAEMPRAQFDGPGGDDTKEEDDEDAINSDLDDPDDLDGEDNEGEDSVGQVMLCTYDKVQRVKNKWKCTLKDGVLTTGGKEYVFHKGQGEFEW